MWAVKESQGALSVGMPINQPEHSPQCVLQSKRSSTACWAHRAEVLLSLGGNPCPMPGVMVVCDTPGLLRLYTSSKGRLSMELLWERQPNDLIVHVGCMNGFGVTLPHLVRRVALA